MYHPPSISYMSSISNIYIYRVVVIYHEYHHQSLDEASDPTKSNKIIYDTARKIREHELELVRQALGDQERLPKVRGYEKWLGFGQEIYGDFLWKYGQKTWKKGLCRADLFWLVVGNHGILWFSIQLGIVTPTDFHIFQRGWNHQPVFDLIIGNKKWSWIQPMPGVFCDWNYVPKLPERNLFHSYYNRLVY